jgi:hypothetical protein
MKPISDPEHVSKVAERLFLSPTASDYDMNIPEGGVRESREGAEQVNMALHRVEVADCDDEPRRPRQA